MRLRIRTKILFGFIVLCLILLAVGLISIGNMRKQRDDFDRVITTDVPSLQKINETRAKFLNKMLQSRGFIIFNTSEHMALFEKASSDLDLVFQDLKPIAEETGCETLLTELLSLDKEYTNYAKEAFNLTIQKEDVATVGAYLSQYGAPIINRTNTVLDTLEKRIKEEAQLSIIEAEKTQRSSLILMIIALVLGLGLSVLLGVIISHRITKPILAVNDALSLVAMGDFTVQVPVASKDEVGDLCKSLNSVTDKVSEAIKEVMISYQSVSTGALEMAKAVEQQAESATQVTQSIDVVAKGAFEQQSSIEQANEVMKQLSAAIDQITQGAQEQAQSVDSTFQHSQAVLTDITQVNSFIQSIDSDVKANAEAAKQGRDGNLQVYNSMQNIEKGISEATKSVQLLEQGSKKIGAIVEIINDISDQTNLLALNAAIEAARAGEHGRGFAVVADEVRVLASRTRESTNEIAGIVNELGTAINSASEAVEISKLNVAEGTEVSEQSRQMLELIATSAQKINARIDELTQTAASILEKSQQVEMAMNNMAAVTEESSAAAEEMNASSKQFMDNVESIAVISRDNAAASEEVAAAVEEQNANLEELSATAGEFLKVAEKVNKLLSTFKV